MPVPIQSVLTRRLRPLISLALLFSLAAAPLFARDPEPPHRIPLDSIGFEPLTTQFLLAGFSMLTLHFVDDQHLLVTFSVRRLLKRLPDDPEDDEDRNIEAILLELPSGHVLARTAWRVHDRGQYLWSLNHGRFLLRIRDTLTTFAPLANLATDQPFRETPFLNSQSRRLGALLLSPDADLLIVQSLERTPPVPRPKTPLFGPTPPPSPPAVPKNRLPVQINIYRLSRPATPGDEIRPRVGGVARSQTTGNIAATTAGYLAIVDQGQQHWAFDFNSYTGKNKQLSPFDSSCRPAPFFVSSSEFIAFGCHGGQSRQAIGGFNMRGEEMWEQNLYGDYTAPSLVFAPASGRFALSRILTRSSLVSLDTLSADQLNSQSVVVYQTDSGKQVFRAECSPIALAGQNFSLSPNGLSLAVIHNDAIEIHRLPSLSHKEQEAVKLAQASAPEANEAPILLSNQWTPPSDATDPATDRATDPAAPPSPVSSSPAADRPTAANSPAAPPAAASQTPQPGNLAPPPTSSENSSGDAPPGQPRTRPTLYTLPGDPPPADRPK
ncbi:MAG TPA: hypothetical protein VK627_01490 [Edaphobacter sp.]|nr:hypothetical protein [Edaphobacter sp.]